MNSASNVRRTLAGHIETATSRRLPSGRSLVGAALIVIAVGGVLAAHRAAVAPPSNRVVVATRDLLPGTIIAPTDLGALAVELPESVPAVAADDADRLLGSALASRVPAGSLIRPADVASGGDTAAPGTITVSLELDAGRAPAGLRPGLRVDVLATDTERGDTSVVATGATVVERPEVTEEAIGASSGARVDLAVSDAAVAAAIVDAAVRQDVTLVVPTPGAPRA